VEKIKIKIKIKILNYVYQMILMLVYKVGRKDSWGSMCNDMAHNISGWEPQLEQTHVHFICHLLCGFWGKKHEYVHVVYKMLLINRALF
jgi:hypothetical protein